jgi:Fic family protein
MPIKLPVFEPHYMITPQIASDLMRIEAVNRDIQHLPMTPMLLASLRESARLSSTHYSTKIEGNQLTLAQVGNVIEKSTHIPGKERDEREVKGYYAALDQIDQWIAKGSPLTENSIKKIHAIVMGGGRRDLTASAYRDGQNVIRDSNGFIVYLPPEAQDVPKLMKELMAWIVQSVDIPAPIVAGIAHYQFATIHPYYDGNGRTARLLATFILHTRGYDLKGIYSLEEYYAQNLSAYYQAISIGPSHNYYMGRAQADITAWISYFIEGMAVACEKVVQQMHKAATRGEPDQAHVLRTLDIRQRKVIGLFKEFDTITAAQIGALMGLQARAAALLCKKWVADGFLEIVDHSKKKRSYRLAARFQKLHTL